MNFISRSNPIKALAALAILVLLTASAWMPRPAAREDAPAPPNHVVKLIFIHHSTGENWLTDGYGNLGRTLDQNNYFVSDTNYGWGPDAIGDRTDIPNWVEWFSSGTTPTYMQALYNETEQHSSYTRTLSDPGGENEIIMFKSCFPNSELDGNPNDPPGTYEEMTISGAKYVYNTILRYFATRPDKLFIVITAPPLSDSSYADNARAFNNWLVNDWLRENNYTLQNVAVFDFYNILTDNNAHHRIVGDQVEHVLGSRNTLAYPSGDDHPSQNGSRKATEEFIPMLNYFYALWQGSNPPSEPPANVPTSEPVIQPEAPGQAVPQTSDFGDFESGAQGWEPFRDESTSSTMICGLEQGSGRTGNSLRLDFDIVPNSWGTCALMFDSPQNWSVSEGLVFYYIVDQAGFLFDIDLYAGTSENRETYLYTIEAPAESAEDWVSIELRWEDFLRASWEANAGESFTKADAVTGIAFGVNTLPDAPNVGSFRVDDIGLIGAGSPPVDQAEVEEPGEEPQVVEPEEPEQETGRRGLSCGGATVIPIALIGFALLQKRSRKVRH